MEAQERMDWKRFYEQKIRSTLTIRKHNAERRQIYNHGTIQLEIRRY